MTEETFVRELERRADDVHGAPLTFESVRGRAVQIRRRRRVATAAVVAAVAAAVVLPSALSGRTSDSAPDPAPAPARVAPGTSVLHDGTLTLPDGGVVDLPLDNADVSELGVLTDGRIVAALQTPYVVRVYGSDGTVQASYRPAENTITMSPWDDAVAWVDEDLSVRVLSSGVAEPAVLDGIPMPGEAVGSIDAVLDAEHLLVGDHTTTTGMLTPDGVADLGAPAPFRVVDVSPTGGLWAVTFLPEDDRQYGCVGLYDPDRAEVVERSCDVNPLGFAPDGRHLLSGYYENNQLGDVTILDLRLRVVTSLDPEGPSTALSRAAWSDPGHVLAGVADWRTSDWTLTRYDTGGDVEVLGGRTAGLDPERGAEYVLSE